MADIRLKKYPAGHEHHYIQVSKSYAAPGKSYLAANFQCKKCGEERTFAIAMCGYYIKKKKIEGGIYV